MESFRRKYLVLRVVNRGAAWAATVLYWLVFTPAWLLGGKFRALLKLHMHRRTFVRTTERGVTFVCDHTNYFMRSLFAYAKETETVEWIGRIPPDAIVWDIGANVGVFALLAARRGCSVVAFEPLAANYAALVRNFSENGLAGRARVLNVALHVRSGLSTMVSPDSVAGTAFSVVDAPGEKTAPRGSTSLESTVVCLRADEAVETWALPVPNYIKLDVDGNELDILRGAGNVLANPALRSVLVELAVDDAGSAQISQLLESAGFAVASRHRHDYVENVIFERAPRGGA